MIAQVKIEAQYTCFYADYQNAANDPAEPYP